MTNERPIEGIDWHGEGDTSLRLENGRISGSGGINWLTGDYTLTDDRLTFGAVATTRMAGPPELMESEQRFLAALARVGRWSTDHEPETAYSLMLADGDGVELLRLVAEPAA